MSRDQGARGAGDSMKGSDRGEAPGWNIEDGAGHGMSGSADSHLGDNALDANADAHSDTNSQTSPLDALSIDAHSPETSSVDADSTNGDLFDADSFDGNSISITRSGGIALPMFATDAKAVAGERSAVGMGRREALKIMGLAAAAGASGMGVAGCAPDDPRAAGVGAGTGIPGGQRTAGATNPKARGWPWDPDLVAPVRPWDLVLTEDERAGLAVLADVIIPADDLSPAASQVGAVDYIDEWVSAPMDGMRRDLVLVRGGLVWLDQESARRFGVGMRFRDLSMDQKHAICDDICYRPNVAPENMTGYRFFSKIRDLTATAFYTSDEGMDDIGYIGNTPLPEWGPPPPEVLAHLGLESAE